MENDLASALRAITKTNDEVYAKVCQVVEINQNEKTVNVTPVDGTATIYNVRLQADSETGGLVLFPKIKSMVLVAFINKNAGAVINTSELDKFSLSVEPCQLEIDATGFLLKKENETLKKLMTDLITAIKALKFTTNNGPTINLINVADFVALENRFNHFLK